MIVMASNYGAAKNDFMYPTNPDLKKVQEHVVESSLYGTIVILYQGRMPTKDTGRSIEAVIQTYRSFCIEPLSNIRYVDWDSLQKSITHVYPELVRWK